MTSTSVGWRFLGFMDVMTRHFGSSGRSRYGFSDPRRILHHTSVFSKSKSPEKQKRALKSSRARRTSGPIGLVSLLIRFLSDYFC